MAVFFKNDCTYGCGLSFPTQSCLIEHIEYTHLDMDPKTLAEYELQNHSCVPLSYILKYSSYECVDLPSIAHIFKHSTHVDNQISPQPAAYDVDTGIEVLIDSYNNNERWTFKKEISEDILHKQYSCSFPGCKKTYKNANGIKYHCRNGHGRIAKRSKILKKKRQVSDNGKKNFDYLARTTIFSSPIYFLSSPCLTETVELELSNRFENNITNNDI